MTFSTAQFKSKVARLGLLQAEMAPAGAPASDPAAVLTSDWLKSILLLMSPEVSKPSPAPYLKIPLDICIRISYRHGWMHRTRSSGP